MPTTRVHSYFSDQVTELNQLSSAVDTQVFVRDNRSVIGFGQALVLSARGPGRIAELSAQWQQLVSKADVRDEVSLPGSGLMAFVSIAFSAESDFESVLVVPERLEVITPDYRWVTEVTVDDHSGSSAAGSSASEPVDPPTAPFRKLEFHEGTQSAEQFLGAVKLASEKIRAGELAKVVLARDLELFVGEGFDPVGVLQRLHRRYPQCWAYSVNSHFGASPELLIRSAQGEVSARVLAGTAARGTDPDVDRAIAEALSHSTKNLHEHRFAVESLVATLEPFCDQISADAEPFSLALPDLWHLASDVTGHLSEAANLLDVVEKLHPTAAVAGTPRLAAENLIIELEPFDRGGYAGPVGWLTADGSGELAIALRGGRYEAEAGLIRAFAGGGIVSESDPDAELEETELKFRAVRWAFVGSD
jgi:menaquinone-specific isochorismate synthase